ncbi:MAG: FAD-dependent oxidoreductase, partial [Planctomycetes bacterium]|nr:FAD-dependent oxidoreductase [Planctomycetota bacterium]
MSSIPDICESSVEDHRDPVADVAVIGAGFSGSLTALLLDRIGLKPVLIDRGRHPRFAIGESSTPMANLILEDLANRYQLPRLVPLTRYATWTRTYPQIVCGLKRGFSYFHHDLDRDFAPRIDHSNELLVAASESDEDADTHWLRSDFDGFLATEAVEAGILYFDQTSIDDLTFHDPVWELTLNRRSDDSPSKCDRHCLRVRFLIDASGDGTFLAKQFQIPSHPNGLRTRSRGLFSHFQNVEKWQDLYRDRGGRVNDHPYPCDAAALHHVFDGGWMWVLRFDNGITSAGFALDPDRFPLDLRIAPQEEWDMLLRRLPAVAEQFRHAKAVIPFRRSGEMQRRFERASGANWAMLPNTAA